MRSSTPHLMLALCSVAVQAAPISPAPKTPDMLTVMARGEVDARDTNNLDVNDYRRRSTSGFSNESEVQNNNVRRSIGGYSYPAGTNAVGRRDEIPTTPRLTTRAPRDDSDADSGFHSDSASNSDSDSDSDGEFQGQDRFAHLEVRDVSPDQDAADVDDEFSNEMFDADAEDGFDDDFNNDSDFDGDDLQTRHAEIKRSIDALLQEDYALERRHQLPNTNKTSASRDVDSDFTSESESDSDSDSDSDDDYSQSKSQIKSQKSGSAVKANAVGASQASAPADKQQDSLELGADAGENGRYSAQVEDPEPEAATKLEMI